MDLFERSGSQGARVKFRELAASFEFIVVDFCGCRSSIALTNQITPANEMCTLKSISSNQILQAKIINFVRVGNARLERLRIAKQEASVSADRFGGKLLQRRV